MLKRRLGEQATSNDGKVLPRVLPSENASIRSNEIIRDRDDYYLGQSGYLRDSNSMLTYPTIESSKSSPDSSWNGGHRRSKRGVTHLYNMIVCTTGCNPLAYKGYGCYCGFLGSGYPMDGIDRCCKMHDWCYNVAECPMFVEYFVPYHWKCYRGYKPICAIEHGEWGGSGSCAQRLCECDRAFAECLRRYRCPRHKAVCTSSPWRLIQNLFMIV
ncbi:group 10 secretory phospholipase A2 isoform X2 [Phymastichus coffea]|uniref:group 10 secretory phospholipase A2 isoform X2 n=1 Tax=Phymastichus coffea TaxID=108790 RepID=UPI00273B79F0|nr:group 10 secretory phospholipase A2 isoform X2 [Phymastichus coffea]